MMLFLVQAFVFLLQTALGCAGVDLTLAAAPTPPEGGTLLGTTDVVLTGVAVLTTSRGTGGRPSTRSGPATGPLLAPSQGRLRREGRAAWRGPAAWPDYVPAVLPSWMRTSARTARAIPSQLRTPTFSFQSTTPAMAMSPTSPAAITG
jgi:hypothetical protein